MRATAAAGQRAGLGAGIMASRAGPRAAGTDGSDFQHRERVAMHYQMRYGRGRGAEARGEPRAVTPGLSRSPGRKWPKRLFRRERASQDSV